MKITPTINHGKTRWRVNIQQGNYRKRLFFETREEAVAFAAATGGPVKFTQAIARRSPQAPALRPAPARQIETPLPASSEPPPRQRQRLQTEEGSPWTFVEKFFEE